MARVSVAEVNGEVVTLGQVKQVDVWYNLAARQYEAMEVKAGRPLKANAKGRVTKRIIGEGATKDEAITALMSLVK